MITDEEFLKERKALTDEVEQLKRNIANTEDRAKNWLELTEKTFQFAALARHHFSKGNLQKKKEIFASLGQNFKLKDGTVYYDTCEWFVPITQSYPKFEKEYLALELDKNGCGKSKTAVMERIRLVWLGRKDSNLRMSRQGGMP